MATTRQDGAPAGTAYACFICGYDTRWNPWSKNRDAHGRPENDGVGEYVKGIGVKHTTTRLCSKVMNHFMDQRLDLSRPQHREDVEA